MDKTADEMFEELGYEKIQDDVNYCIYSFFADGENVFEFRFYKPQKNLELYVSDNIFATIDIEELQAINKKVGELGWNKI